MSYSVCLRCYRVCRTLLSMFRVRGYLVADEFPLTREEFIQMVVPTGGEMFDFRVRKTEDSWLKVCFPRGSKTGVRDLREIVKSATADNIRHIVLVLKRNLTPFAKNRMSEHAHVMIEQFNTLELCRDILQHSLVPPHRLLGKAETRYALARLNLKSTAVMNAIQSNDPVCKYHNAQVGQVFEIRRTSPEGHRYLAYRVVVKPQKIK